MSESSRIGCLICASPIDLDDLAIELLSTVSMAEPGDPAVPTQPTVIYARPAYAHASCGIPDGDTAVRRGPMHELRPAT